MSDRQVKLYSTETPGAKKINTTTISNVNPEIDGSTMKTYAQMLNNLTTNTYVKTDLVETTNLDTETIKQPATITLPTTLTKGQSGFCWFNSLYVNGEEIVQSTTEKGYFFYVTSDNTPFRVTYGNTGSNIGFYIPTSNPISGTMYYSYPETETSYAAVATGTITV